METHVETPSNVIPITQPVPIPTPKAVTLKIPETSKIAKESREVVAFAANGVTVVTHEEYLRVGEKVKSIIRAKKQIQELFKESKDTAHKAHAAICAAEKKLLDPLLKVEAACNAKTKAYLTAKAERERKEAEEKRKAAEEEARKKTEEAQKKQDDDRLRSAQQLHDAGFKEEAEAVLAQEVPPAPPVQPVIAPVEKQETVEGQHLRTNYKFVVDNFLLLIQEVAAGRQPTTLLLPNQKVLNQMAKALKKELRIPGGYVDEDKTVVNKDTPDDEPAA